jgi:hypothetical protein
VDEETMSLIESINQQKIVNIVSALLDGVVHLETTIMKQGKKVTGKWCKGIHCWG